MQCFRFTVKSLFTFNVLIFLKRPILIYFHAKQINRVRLMILKITAGSKGIKSQCVNIEIFVELVTLL